MNELEKNLTILKKKAAYFFHWVMSAPPDASIEPLHTASGRPNLRFKSEDGTSRLLYEWPDPAGRERKKIEKHSPAFKRAMVIFGLGLGYRVAAWSEIMPPGHVIFIVEEKPALIRLAMEVSDFSESLAKDALVFVPPHDHFLHQLATHLVRHYRQGESAILIDEECRGYFSKGFRAKVERFIHEVVTGARHETALIDHAAETAENEIMNLAHTLLSPDISCLKGALAGTPAVVVSAGPSLGHNLPFLAQALGRAIIIATAPALRPLLAYDIRPDLLGILDYTPSNYDVLQDVYTTEDVPLIFLEQTYPRVIREFQGELISMLAEQSVVRKWLGPRAGDRDGPPVKANVGGFCIELAIYLGAEPIILVGQDLAFPDSHSHGEGIIGRREMGPSTAAAATVWLEAVNGGKVQSNLTMAAYLEDLLRTINRGDRSFINTSPNGARIRGTLEMSLDQAIKRYCPKEHNFRPAISRLFNEPVRDFAAASSEISKLDTELEALDVVISKSLELNGRITSLAAGPDRPAKDELRTLLDAHAKYAAATLKYCEVFPPLKKYLTPHIALLTENERTINRESNWQDTIVQAMQPSRVMMAAARQAGARLRQLLTDVRETLTEIMETSQALKSSNDGLEIHCRAAAAWVKLGRLKKAWRHFREALVLAPEDAGLIIEAARLCLSRERLTTARELLKQVPADHPQHQLAKAVLDHIEETEQGWLTRAKDLLSGDDWIGALLLSRKALDSDNENTAANEIEKRCLELREERLTSAK